MAMTLAELLAEARRREERARKTTTGQEPSTYALRALDIFYAEHGPRLARVAEAAVEMRRIGGCVLLPGGNDGCPCSICEATRAFDAAASGEGRG